MIASRLDNGVIGNLSLSVRRLIVLAIGWAMLPKPLFIHTPILYRFGNVSYLNGFAALKIGDGTSHF